VDYLAHPERYNKLPYNHCGKSGLKLPALSLGLWHNFGMVDNFETSKAILHAAFDEGITHFDLANNYGPPAGSAEENFGRILHMDFHDHRDEMIISTKAGYKMWDGPYGDGGSRKYLISSLDQSLKRMEIEYVDIFYSHRPDPNTPVEETMMALDHAVRQGKALYTGISNYPPEKTRECAAIAKQLGTPLIIHQPRYSMFERGVEGGLLDLLETEGMGAIAFSPLAQGLLTNKYLKGIPEGSRAASKHGFLKKEHITEEKITQIRKLDKIADERGQSLAQMALTWLMRDKRITSVLIGVSSVKQLYDNLHCLDNPGFTSSELEKIESILQT